MLMWSGFARVWEADDEGDGRGDRTTVRHGHRCLLRECDPELDSRRRPKRHPLIILKADNHQGSDRWDVYVSKTVYPTAESYGTLAGVLRMLADDVEIMAREKEMGGGQ